MRKLFNLFYVVTVVVVGIFLERILNSLRASSHMVIAPS